MREIFAFSRALRRNVRGCNIRVSNASKPHPLRALHIKYLCVGEFLSVLIFALTALSSKSAKFVKGGYSTNHRPVPTVYGISLMVTFTNSGL